MILWLLCKVAKPRDHAPVKALTQLPIASAHYISRTNRQTNVQGIFLDCGL